MSQKQRVGTLIVTVVYINHACQLRLLSFGRRRWALWVLAARIRQSACLLPSCCCLSLLLLLLRLCWLDVLSCHCFCQAALTLYNISLVCNKQATEMVYKFSFQRTNCSSGKTTAFFREVFSSNIGLLIVSSVFLAFLRPSKPITSWHLKLG